MKSFLLINLRQAALFLGVVYFLFSCSPSDPLQELKEEVEQVFQDTPRGFALAFKQLDGSETALYLNEKEQFHAASTMKVPIMIELYRQAREGRFNLSDTIVIKNEFKSIVDGNSYVLVLLSKNLGDFEEGTLRLAEVSKRVYDYVSKSK